VLQEIPKAMHGIIPRHSTAKEETAHLYYKPTKEALKWERNERLKSPSRKRREREK
jgi:hypothetical protein